MRTLLLLIILSVCPCVLAQQIPANTKVAKIEEIFRLTKTDQIQKQMMNQMMAMIKQQNVPGATEEQKQAALASSQKMMEFIMQKMSWAEMKTQFIKVYDDTYTEEEISGILMFYQSPAGQAMLAKSPALMGNMMKLVQTRMMELKPEMEQLLKQNPQK